MSIINELIEMSNRYGSDAEYVLAGGGNTSCKDKGVLYIKGSGTSLATIREAGFVKMDTAKLAAMWTKDYGTDPAHAEKAVLRDMMDARLLGEEDKRPSVETLLHHLLPGKLVLHLHPALVNGLTCGRDGEKKAAELFPAALFMRATKPGYVLAVAARDACSGYQKKFGKAPQTIIIQNHGIFFSADTLKEMDALVAETMSTLKKQIKRFPDFSAADFDRTAAVTASVALRTAYKKAEGKGVCVFTANKETVAVAKSASAFEKAAGLAFSPDHIVYCRHKALYSGSGDAAALVNALTAYRAEYGFSPKIVFVKGLGMFSLGKSKKEADIAREVFLDELKISVYSEAFGGPLFMSKEDTDFILNWEVESYRQKVALGGSVKRLESKIAIVTGAAQGYGAGIAREMAAAGALVVIADLNSEGAAATAKEIEAEFGAGAALAVRVDVSDEVSVRAMTEETALYYGGLDILVSNAGVAKAGSLDEMDMKTFDFVTRINYNAYFLCAKYASKIMKQQYAADPDSFSDIIQINSKSGLEGSNKNFAYAGSKFGGIGLTQSFALELTPFNIKVNSVCPGNFFEGPLWADPEKGLFVQYLKAGKVPGAKTVADVKAAYEAKIPMNRGCRIGDVARAIFYIVEQEYETGQAVPVAGGQVMLS